MVTVTAAAISVVMDGFALQLLIGVSAGVLGYLWLAVAGFIGGLRNPSPPETPTCAPSHPREGAN
ncbi:hypothetical protein [Actinorhabdospora filicis]|uniref:hypothetical protein n=1 Tax=Actinorhabdospora filicis TaxID=1785913 RepID=UPI00255365D8|nr:hypothetical protein [Actinorhabdospora filicis]